MAIEGAHWIVGSDLLQSPWLDEKYSFTIRGDTSIQGEIYKKVFQDYFEFNEITKSFSNKIISSRLYAFIRDDVSLEKVFAILEPLPYDHSCPENESFVLFDFSVGQGDTLNWCPLQGRRLHTDSVTIVDSIRLAKPFFSEQARRTFYTVFAVALHNDGTAVERVVPIVEGFGYAHTDPFLQGNLLIDYCIGDNADCGLLSKSQEPAITMIRVYPNPGTEELIIEANNNSSLDIANSTLQLVTMTGTVLKQQWLSAPYCNVSVTEIPKGFYMVRLLQKGKVTYQGRWIKN